MICGIITHLKQGVISIGDIIVCLCSTKCNHNIPYITLNNESVRKDILARIIWSKSTTLPMLGGVAAIPPAFSKASIGSLVMTSKILLDLANTVTVGIK